MIRRGSKKTYEADSLIIFNHFRFVVNTVSIDPISNSSKSDKEKKAAEKSTISDVEVIPMR